MDSVEYAHTHTVVKKRTMHHMIWRGCASFHTAHCVQRFDGSSCTGHHKILQCLVVKYCLIKKKKRGERYLSFWKAQIGDPHCHTGGTSTISVRRGESRFTDKGFLLKHVTQGMTPVSQLYQSKPPRHHLTGNWKSLCPYSRYGGMKIVNVMMITTDKKPQGR